MPEVLDPTGFPQRPVARVGPELLAARRAFPKAQELLSGGPTGQPVPVEVGWYDTGVQAEVGSFGCVATDSGLDDLIGQIVRVRYDNRQVFVYVLALVTLPEGVQLGLARRAFIGLARLSVETVAGDVVVVA